MPIPTLPLLGDVPAERLANNINRVLSTLEENRFQDQAPAKLIAVTKTVEPRVINQLKPIGILDIGENRAQVALPKLPEIAPGIPAMQVPTKVAMFTTMGPGVDSAMAMKLTTSSAESQPWEVTSAWISGIMA